MMRLTTNVTGASAVRLPHQSRPRDPASEEA
jgi:hypothetical protein